MAGRLAERETVAAALRRCGRERALAQGERLHREQVPAGDVYLENLAIDMYGRCGAVERAEALFHGMADRRNAFTWPALMFAYARNARPSSALALFRRLLLEGGPEPPHTLALSAAMAAAAATASLRCAAAVHSVLGGAATTNVVVGTGLVTMYGRCPDGLGAARDVFEAMRWRTVVTWNAMISAYARHRGAEERAVELYRRLLLEPWLRPNRVTYFTVVGACTSLGDLETGREVHAAAAAAAATDGAAIVDPLVAASLIKMYGQCFSLTEARKVFDGGRVKRSAAMWTAMISACVDNGSAAEAVELFRQMDVPPDRVTLAAVFAACASSGDAEEGARIHTRFAEQLGLDADDDVVLWTSLVDMYAKSGDLLTARRLFDEGKPSRRNAYTWTAMISAYAQRGYPEVALDMSRRMDLEGVKFTEVTVLSLLGAIASLELLDQGKLAHERAAAEGWDSTTRVGNAIIYMYSRCRETASARRVFDRLSNRNLVSFSAMISAYARQGDGTSAVRLVHRMDAEGVKPDGVAFVNILNACASSTATTSMVKGGEIHDRIRSAGIEVDAAVSAALLNMYEKSGGLEQAKQVFEAMVCRDTVGWSTLVAAYALHGSSVASVEAFHRMRLEGVEVDEVVYTSILAGCSHSGLLDQATAFFLSMVADDGLQPQAAHYGTMVDLLARGGRLEQAADVVKSMPLSPDDRIRTAVLSGCSVPPSGQVPTLFALHGCKSC